MKERPILFSAPMVRAILEGRKTQTRRIVKLTDSGRVKAVGSARNWHLDDPNAYLACPYGQPGDRLWVRETFLEIGNLDPGFIVYRADYPECVPDGLENIPSASAIKWKPSIHMPRSASRMTLEITNIRVERLNDISEEDAIAEGVDHRECPTYQSPEQLEHMIRFGSYAWTIDYPGGFKSLWESINGEDSWGANPWVWVIEFERIEGGIL